MSTTFIDAMQTKDVIGENAMPAHSTSGDKVLDFFSSSGAMRKSTDGAILGKWRDAFSDEPGLAMKALFYARDIRGGQGERRLFRLILQDLADRNPEFVLRNLGNIPEFGRWDDLEALRGTDLWGDVIQFWLAAIEGGNGLAAKWYPRKGPLFGEGRRRLELGAREFRKLLVSQTKVVETQMCAKEWEAINYSHVPSQASLKYRKAFHRNDGERYRAFIAKAEKGEVKINAATLYPSDIVNKVLYRGDSTAEALWKQLPDFVGESSRGFLPICDVSGSMSGQPMTVSIALGIYLAERNKSVFKDTIVTFSEDPEFYSFGEFSTLRDRVAKVMHAPWGMSTNLEKTFEVILKRAQKANVKPEDMPSSLLIISDMQFNECVKNRSRTGLEMIQKMYKKAGYEMPQVVFWNVQDSIGKAAKKDDQGVALVSGYSPSIMKSILASVPEATPMDIMLETLSQERYSTVWRG